MELSMTTDYATSVGSPWPYLERIARAGFSHVHWCHQWNTDFMYAPSEVEQISRWLGENHLRLLDLHGSEGVEKRWLAPCEYQRLAGLDLVTNRVEMTARLGGRAVIMHMPPEPTDATSAERFWRIVEASLDALRPVCRDAQVRIAIENGGANQFATLAKALERYDESYLGLCYDSGHGNVAGDGLEWLERLKHRLVSLHLHDNDGTADQHKPLFTGTVDWARLADIIARSSYQGPVSQELSIRLSGYEDEDAFLAQAHADGTRLARMIAQCRAAERKG